MTIIKIFLLFKKEDYLSEKPLTKKFITVKNFFISLYLINLMRNKILILGANPETAALVKKQKKRFNYFCNVGKEKINITKKLLISQLLVTQLI